MHVPRPVAAPADQEGPELPTSRSAATRMVRALAAQLEASVVETHISWVLLAGADAWKLRKPVRLPFLDYSTPALRRHFCEEDIRLNQRLAPDLYLGVVPVTGTPAAPRLGGSAPVIDHAVHMRRFREQDLFSSRVDAGRIVERDADHLADLLGAFHQAAPPAPAEGPFGTASRRAQAAAATLPGLRHAIPSAEVRALRQWFAQEAERLGPLWTTRLRQGHVREGHGDLHLANIVRQATGLAAFDCIEFDAALRWIDVIDDVAFAVMDFAARGRRDLGFRLLNRWLDATGEHEGLPLLRHSLAYRALVRAQVMVLGRASRSAGDPRPYLEAALGWTRPGGPQQLTIMHGLPGSGKTTVSQRLLERDGAIRVRSDVERRRLGVAPGGSAYGAQTSNRTYDRLFSLARLGLEAGFPVVIDAAFLRREHREGARRLAAECGARFVISACQAPMALMSERIAQRIDDASEATPAVLEQLAREVEPLADSEAPFCQSGGTG